MIPITNPETASLARELLRYERKATVSRAAGLLTAPRLQANAIRIELLVHLAVTHCRGRKRPGFVELGEWLNRNLGTWSIASTEDPVEDVFISNVKTPVGNRRIFEGTWEANDYFVQVTIDALLEWEPLAQRNDLLRSVFALLRVSDFVAERLGLKRWHTQSSNPKGRVPVERSIRVEERAQAVSFTRGDIARLGISRDDLLPFILRDTDVQLLPDQTIGNTSLERRPMIEFDDILVLALPSAVSPAIRQYVLEEIGKVGLLSGFGKALAARQAEQLQKEGLSELRDKVLPYPAPRPSQSPMPSFHSVLLKYDINKYMHVVLLHDRLDSLVVEGFSSFLIYPEPIRNALQKNLEDVAKACLALPDCDEGMTLIVLGGMGRGFSMEFDAWPDGWGMSILRLSDLIMLAGALDRPINQFLKCIKHKEWAEQRGVSFININGDFNFYCYWREKNFRIVPLEVPITHESNIVLSNDFVLELRKKLRSTVDQHVAETVAGHHVRVMSLSRESYFESMQGRPIYGSIDHVREGVLAGVVETKRGATWLVIEADEDHGRHKLAYELWSGIIGLLDRAIVEIEVRSRFLKPIPIEIRLDLRALKLLEGSDLDDGSPAGMPEIAVDIASLIVAIRLPPQFLRHFHSPDNVGDQILLGAMSEGLIRLHEGLGGDVSAITSSGIIDLVLGDTGARVLHLFRTYVPVEHLMSTSNRKAVFVAKEDFSFEALDLAEGCVSSRGINVLKGTEQCNQFLHSVVEKVCHGIKDMLKRFDRTSVIRNALEIHESLIQDRVHWRRTAKAILALHKPGADVNKVAHERERERNTSAIAARTLMEMAVCESPVGHGKKISNWELDALMAKASLLLEVASDSEAIHGELVVPEIHLHANGEYSLARSFHEKVILPFIQGYFQEEFKEAARGYEKLYRRERITTRSRADEIYSSEFIAAFTVEYGLTPDEAIEGFAELLDFAVEKATVVVETTMGEIRQRLKNNRKMSDSSCQAFIDTFGLFSRPEWDKPPDGYRSADIFPWRFRRPLSSVARPILVFGPRDDDKGMYGAGQLRDGFGYLFDRIEHGHLPGKEFFRSEEMRRYIGSVVDRRGEEFENTVASAFSELGWKTRWSLKITELGGSKELGDIDVLAWNDDKSVLIIECKRLMLARTIAEISEVCSNFRGEARDYLAKHISRFRWVKENLGSLERVIGRIPESQGLDMYLVTNTEVPMMYLTSLPIPNEKVLPLRLLHARFALGQKR